MNINLTRLKVNTNRDLIGEASNKRKYIDKVPANELALIIALTGYKDYSKEGWMTQKETMSQIGTDGQLLFKSERTNFPKYIKSLVNKGLVETSVDTTPDERGRPRSLKIWRLKRDSKSRYNIYGLIVSSVSWSYDKGWQSNLKQTKFKIVDNTVLKNTLTKSDYFKDIDKSYDDILDERIHHYEIQIQLLKNIKRLRSMKF